MKAFKTLLKTELKLSLRGMDMIIFAICMPLVVLIFTGSLYGKDNSNSLAQSFGAISTIAICAGGLMGLPLVVSDYRNKKILKRFKVTPTSPMLILFVQVTIYAIYAFVSLALNYVVASLLFDFRLVGSPIIFLLIFILVMISMFSIGMMVGGVAPDSKTASIIASLLYFPMLAFSGATIPYDLMPSILQKFSDLLPLTQGIKLLESITTNQSINTVVFPIILMISIALICGTIAIKCFKWE